MAEVERSAMKRFANHLVSRVGGRPLAGLAIGAVLVPLLAVSAVAGLEGSDNSSMSGGTQLAADGTAAGTPGGGTAEATGTPEPLSAAMAAHTDGNGCDDVLFADGMHAPTPGGPADCTVGNSGEHRQNGRRFATGTASATADASASPSPTASSTATGPHANGKGCDDVLFKDGARPPVKGGPAGCTVGNSADHRQNGKEKGTPTAEPSATETASATATATGTATATSTTGANDPHANGRGCDDVNEHQPGGPQGCEVGNSADHRKNGANNSTTPAPTASTPAGGGAGGTGSAGPGRPATNPGKKR